MNFSMETDPRDGALMVQIPEGPFRMGLPEGDLFAEPHELPEREIVLSAFWMDVHPVTNGRYLQFISAGGYEDSQWWCPDGWEWLQKQPLRQPAMWESPGWDGPEQPVAGVSWYEADAYARWAGKRLPSDAEWEKAARGTDGRRYPWGDEWPGDDRANYDNRLGRTSPVGLYPDGISPYGCHDMAGNVNNWTADWYWPDFGQWCVDQNALINPVLDDEICHRLRPLSINEKVDRGGGFATPLEMQEVLGCTRKTHWTSESRHPWNGFRTAK